MTVEKNEQPEPATEKVSTAAIAKQEMEELERKAKEDYKKQEQKEETAGDTGTSQGNDMMAAFLARASE